MSKQTSKKYKIWKVLNERQVFSAKPWFTVNVQSVKLPDGRIINDYFQIRVPDAVVMVCSLSDGRIVMIRQYLHGLSRVSLVLPAGTVQKGESPLHAVKRELREETGYSCAKWELSGVFAGHNNYGCGKIYIYYGGDAHLEGPPDSGDLEEMDVFTMKRSAISKAIRNGEISAFGTIAALSISKQFLR
jgi:ADP-ribose pyrophosphatase